jgi:phytanoyl-CoA hydroxylase
LKPEVADDIAAKFEGLFAGEFDTGVYPDEWYGRSGMRTPAMTREICNIWKSDSYLARNVMLSRDIHRLAAQLHDWPSSRLAQDDILFKPAAGGSAVGIHRDSKYISEQFYPLRSNSVTVWMPLDDVSLESGTIEYVRGKFRIVLFFFFLDYYYELHNYCIMLYA